MPKFTGEESRQFGALKEGDYTLKISEIREDVCGEKTKNPGADMWRVTYEVEGTNRKVFDNLVFVKKSYWRISNWWRALGHKVVPGQDIDVGTASDHYGRTLEAHLVVEEYNGDPQNDIAYFIFAKKEDAASGAIVPAKKEEKEPDDIPF
jgi:hypothetical protein